MERAINLAESGPSRHLTAVSRVVLSIAVDVADTVQRAMGGDPRPRTARGNAWEAVCADRERAHRRDELRRVVAALGRSRATTQPRRVAAAPPGPAPRLAPASVPHAGGDPGPVS